MSNHTDVPSFQPGPGHEHCNCQPKPATLNRRNFLRLGGLAGVTALTAASLMAGGGMAGTAHAAAGGGIDPGPTMPGPQPQLNPFMMVAPNLTNWLNQYPAIRDAVVWEDEGTALKYSQWPQTLKTRLQNIFEAIWTPSPVIGTSSYPNARYYYTPPKNIMNYSSLDISTTVLTKADTLTNYLNYLAYSFRNELAKQVSWSMKTLTSSQLANILDSRTIYKWVTGKGPTMAYDLPAGYTGGYQVLWTNLPTHPLLTLQFLQKNNLIGQTHTETIGRLIYWCGQNLLHYGVTPKTKDYSPGKLNYEFWQYYGAPPINRMIDGTDPIEAMMLFGHWTAGCWGTVAFLKMVLQVVNIPVENVYMMGHSLPHFTSIGTYLSHGDDPYTGQLLNKHPELPGTIYLINQYDFDTHFGNGVSDLQKQQNVSYRAMQLLAQYP